MEKAQNNNGQARWTFMVYMVGDNNLDCAALRDIAEMAKVGSMKDVHILVQLDRIANASSSKCASRRKRSAGTAPWTWDDPDRQRGWPLSRLGTLRLPGGGSAALANLGGYCAGKL